jgi:hypothetical protein
MEIEPPQPSFPDTGKMPRRGRAYLTVLLLWLGLLLVITMIAWVMLWSGGVKEARPVDRGEGASTGKTEQQQRS